MPTSPALTINTAPVEGSSLWSWRMLFPFTLRGTLLLLCTLYLLIWPARTEIDIVAATLGLSFGALLTFLVLGTVLQALKLRGLVTLQMNREVAVERFESEALTTLILKLPRFSVVPFFLLTLRPRFSSREVELPEFRMTGSVKGPRYLSYRLAFPHRGIWNIDQVLLNFGDQLGLTQFQWQLYGSDLERSFTVYPPLAEESFPVISSCERPGDTISHAHERQGDPFDFKQYHPADGARKILWKVFARRGELISRHPEASMTPEGQVVMFVPALPREDHVCSAAINYAEKLSELNLDVYCGCAGAGPSAASSANVEQLLVDSVWNADGSVSDMKRDISYFLSSVTASLGGEQLKRVIIFTSAQRFRTEADLANMMQLTDSLEAQNITPVFMLVSKIGSADMPRRSAKTTHKGVSRILRLWFSAEPQTISLEEPTYKAFLQTCARKQWELFQ